MRKYFEMMKKLILLTILFASLLLTGCGQKRGDKTTNWRTYRNKEYGFEVTYPLDMLVSEVGQDNRRVVISTPDYKVDVASGTIVSGFKIDVYPVSKRPSESLSEVFYCNKGELRFGEQYCLLSDTNSQILGYKQGSVDSEMIEVDNYPSIRYEFISSVDENNNVGLIIEKGDIYYIMLIAYREYKDMKLFDQILSTFKFVET